MVHDPRAPRLAAMATLSAAILVLLTAVNVMLNIVGATGLSREEGASMIGVGVLLFVANFANKQREIPELTARGGPNDVETFATMTASSTTATQNEVNPTTASILTSILGERETPNQQQVNTAIDALTSGEFGAAVQQTLDEIGAANQITNEQREALPADDETGQTLERVLVQPVPLPGLEGRKLVDPSSIPGLQPNRTFVTSGVASVPLPDVHERNPTDQDPTTSAAEASPSPPTLPDLPDLPELPAMLELPEVPHHLGHEETQESPLPSILDLPDLDGLFEETPPPTTLSEEDGLPDLPDLDDLF